MQKIIRCFRSKIRILMRYLFRRWLELGSLEKIITTSKEILTELTKSIWFLRKNEKQLFILFHFSKYLMSLTVNRILSLQCCILHFRESRNLFVCLSIM